VTRWSEEDLQRYQARNVGPNGEVSRNPVPITTRIKKYRNKPTMVDEILFDSVAEAKRYNELKFFQAAGQISNLELQPKFPLEVNGALVCTYIADFSYMSHGYRVIEDVKSNATKTPQYRIKVKLLKALTGIVVLEVA
jgi:hypothetical protein